MRRILLLALVALAACTDDLPFAAPAPTPGGARGNVLPQPAEWQGYWRNDDTLWIYDMRPEVGMNAAVHDSVRLNRLAETHTRLVRHHHSWLAEANYPGQFDGAVQYLKNGYNMEFVVIVEESGAAIHPTDSLSRHNLYVAYADHMNHLQTLYRDVRFWQLGNEPDNSCPTGRAYNGSTRTDSGVVNSTYTQPNRYAQGWNYAQMLKVVYPRMKAKAAELNTQAWILTAGLTGEEEYVPSSVEGVGCSGVGDVESWRFLSGIYAGGGRQFFDYLAIHAYGETATGGPNTQRSFLQTTYTIRDLLHGRLNDPYRPVWVTELGSSAVSSRHLINDGNLANDGAQIDEIQREWFSTALSIQRSGRHIQKIFPYSQWTADGGDLPNSGVAGQPPENYSFGIIRADHSRRPSHLFLQNEAPLGYPLSQPSRQGSYTIPVFGRIPESVPFTYAGDHTNVTLNSISVHSLTPTAVRFFIPIVYRAHVSDRGWLTDVFNDQVAGTVGESRDLQSLQIRRGHLDPNIQICAQANVGTQGWGGEVCGGDVYVGTTGQGLPMKQVALRLVDPTAKWRICYEAHVGNVGWMAPVCDGVPAGSTNAGENIQAIRVRMYRQ